LILRLAYAGGGGGDRWWFMNLIVLKFGGYWKKKWGVGEGRRKTGSGVWVKY